MISVAQLGFVELRAFELLLERQDAQAKNLEAG